MTPSRSTDSRTVLPRWASRRWSRLALWQRRAIKTIAGVIVFVVLSSLLYHFVLIVFEGRSPRFGHSVQVVIETTTGTGYGSDSPWESAVANAFVSFLDLSTFLLLFIILPYVFRPVLENAMSPRIPTTIDESDHVVVCGIEQQGERLIDELEARNVDYVVIAEREERVLELMEAGIPVVLGDLTSAETHRRASVDAARAVVVDTVDAQSVSVLLAIREVNDAIHTVLMVESLERERHLQYAGADQVLTPRHILGRRIAERISTEISPIRSDRIPIGEDFAILELTVFEDSPIHGSSLQEVEADTETSISVLGIWKEGAFTQNPDKETIIDERTGLLISGPESTVRELERETYRGREIDPNVVIAGYGIVGSTVHDGLEHAPADITVVDIEDRPAVDVVGDVTEESTLQAANIEEATVFVVTIADDDDAILTTVLGNELGSNLDIIVRLNHDENEAKVRRAGADYVLNLPEVSGRVLAEEVLHENVLSYSHQLKTVRLDAESFGGQTLENSEIERGDCAVVGVERNGELITDTPPEFEFRASDSVIVIGCDQDVDALTRE